MTNRPRYMISVDDETFQKIEDFRFQNRFPTRSKATAELIRRGLDSVFKDTPDVPEDAKADNTR